MRSAGAAPRGPIAQGLRFQSLSPAQEVRPGLAPVLGDSDLCSDARRGSGVFQFSHLKKMVLVRFVLEISWFSSGIFFPLKE